jgi:hypothetical protein
MGEPREVFVGIDVAKARNAVAIADGERGEVRCGLRVQARSDTVAADGDIRFMGAVSALLTIPSAQAQYRKLCARHLGAPISAQASYPAFVSNGARG